MDSFLIQYYILEIKSGFTYKLELNGWIWLKARYIPLLLIVILVGDKITGTEKTIASILTELS